MRFMSKDKIVYTVWVQVKLSKMINEEVTLSNRQFDKIYNMYKKNFSIGNNDEMYFDFTNKQKAYEAS